MNSPKELSGFCAVVGDLGAEGCVAGEFLLRTHKVEQCQLQSVSIEVALKIEQVSLHAQLATLHHRGAITDVYHRRVDSAIHGGNARIDTARNLQSTRCGA